MFFVNLDSKLDFFRSLFSRAASAAKSTGLYRLRKNYQMAEVLKGHGFSRAASG